MTVERGYRRHKHVSRRTALRSAALASAGLAAAAVIGCAGKKEKPAATLAATGPRPGGTFRYPAHLTTPPYDRGLDPHIQPPSKTGRMRLFYQTVVQAHPRTQVVEPELAQKWEQSSPTELIFTLEPGVKWHNKPPANGRELAMADVVFSLDRIRTPRPEFINRSLLDSLDKIEPIDKSRVRLTLKLADATVLDKLTGSPLAILAPEVVEKAGGKFAEADTAVGTGPFVLTELNDTVAIHVRNPSYWKPGLPYLDQVLMPGFGDEEAKWAAFQSGRIDLMNRIPGNVVRRYGAERGPFLLEQRFPAEWTATPTTWMVFLNVRRKPFDDTRVYRALRLLIDFDEVLKADAELVTGRGSFSQAFPSSLAQWDFSQEEYVTQFLPWKRPKDEAARVALELLGAAGFTRDAPLSPTIVTLTSSDFQRRAQLLQSQWRQLSQRVVQPEIRLIEGAVFDQIRARREFDVLVSGVVAPTDEPDAVLRSVFYTEASRNYAGWSDRRADELIDRQRATFDVEQRKLIIKDILRYLVDHAPSVVWSGIDEVTAAQPRVKGWAPESDSSTFGFQYEQVWLES